MFYLYAFAFFMTSLKTVLTFAQFFDFNQCFDQCYCKSGKVHGFDNLHCEKHFKLLSDLFSHYTAIKSHCVNLLCCYHSNNAQSVICIFSLVKRSRFVYLLILPRNYIKTLKNMVDLTFLNFFRNKNDCQYQRMDRSILDDLRKYCSCKDFILVYDNVSGKFGLHLLT